MTVADLVEGIEEWKFSKHEGQEYEKRYEGSDDIHPDVYKTNTKLLAWELNQAEQKIKTAIRLIVMKQDGA